MTTRAPDKIKTLFTSARRLIRRAAPSLVLLSISLLVSFALGELVIRLVHPQQLILVRPDVWQGVETYGWTKRPGLATTINTGEGTVHLYSDSLGLRIPASRVESDNTATTPSKKRILLLGDSMMEALQVEYEESLAGLLETRLSSALEAPLEVWNTGVACWGPSQYLLKGRAMMERFDFDYVIVSVYVGNDAELKRTDYFPPRQPTVIHKLRMPNNLSWREIRFALLYPINDFFERRSHFFIAAKNMSEAIRLRFGLGGGGQFPWELRTSEATSPRWEATADIVRQIVDVADEHGVPALVLLIPTPYQVDRELFERNLNIYDLDPADVDLDQPTRLLGDAMRERGLTVVEPLSEMRAAHEAGVQLYGTVDRHLTIDGHAFMEEAISPVIIRDLGWGSGHETNGATGSATEVTRSTSGTAIAASSSPVPADAGSSLQRKATGNSGLDFWPCKS